MVTGIDPKKNGKPNRDSAKHYTQEQRRRVKRKPKSKERVMLEQLEGEDFDTTDFKLVTDWSDEEPF